MEDSCQNCEADADCDLHNPQPIPTTRKINAHTEDEEMAMSSSEEDVERLPNSSSHALASHDDRSDEPASRGHDDTYPTAEDVRKQHEEQYGNAPKSMQWTFEFWAEVERMKLLVEWQKGRIDELESGNRALRVENERLTQNLMDVDS